MPITPSKAATGEVHNVSVRSSADAAQQFARIVGGQDLLASAGAQFIPGLRPISVRFQDPYAPGGDLGPTPIFPMHKDPETGRMVPGLDPADIPRPQPEPAKPAPANPQPAQQPQPSSQQPAGQSGQSQAAQPDATQQGPETVSVVPAGVDEHVFGLPDVTGHKEGDTWEEFLPPTPGNPEGIRRVNTIPFGNGTQTVDQVIYNADGTITRSRVVANGLGGYQRWNNDSTGAGSYVDKQTADLDAYIQSFDPGQSTSGAPTRESGTNADYSNTYQPEYDENGNYVGVSIGVRNDKGFYDNQFQDTYGNTSFDRTIVKPDGGLGSIQAGQVDIEGRGWWLDKENRRWELYKDDNGNRARRYQDPLTGGWSFVYKDGPNEKNETFDSSGRLVNSLTFGPDGKVIGSLERTGALLIQGKPGKDGKLDYTFKDESGNRSRRGTLSYLPGGGMRLYYGDGYETVEYNKFGAEVKRYNRQGDRSFNEWVSQEFALTTVKTLGGMVEGFSGMVGLNDVINMAGTVMGYSPHLATKKEILDSFSQGADSFQQAVLFHNLTALKELTVYRAGGQSLGDAITRSIPSYLTALNAESKLLIGTDWTGFRDNPGAVLATAALGIASWATPTKGIRAIPGRSALVDTQTSSHLPRVQPPTGGTRRPPIVQTFDKQPPAFDAKITGIIKVDSWIEARWNEWKSGGPPLGGPQTAIAGVSSRYLANSSQGNWLEGSVFEQRSRRASSSSQSNPASRPPTIKWEVPEDIEKQPGDFGLIAEYQVWLANNYEGYRTAYYQINGHRLRTEVRDHTGTTPPQLKEVSPGKWALADQIPPPWKPHYGPFRIEKERSNASPEVLKTLDPLAADRRTAIDADTEANRLKLASRRLQETHPSPENAAAQELNEAAYSAVHTAMGKKSELYGEAVSRVAAVPENFPGGKHVDAPGPANGNHRFDDILRFPDGAYFVIETKGDRGTRLNYRTLPDGTKVYEGTREYFFDILRVMKDGGVSAQIAKELDKAFRLGRVRYLEIRGKSIDIVGQDGKRIGLYDGYIVREYDLSKGGTP
ncbi:hypothetical protein ACQPXH_20735 [Nocardia sp. CA-135953]|uniref:hypothetical protein n=1 Tax=Nocardia sp. CA-135953 TaxID=3239978 RepID=UPI003D983577